MLHITFWFMLLMLMYWWNVKRNTSFIDSKENGELSAEKTKYSVCLHLKNRM